MKSGALATAIRTGEMARFFSDLTALAAKYRVKLSVEDNMLRVQQLKMDEPPSIALTRCYTTGDEFLAQFYH